jgi:hypothetical protein
MDGRSSRQRQSRRSGSRACIIQCSMQHVHCIMQPATCPVPCGKRCGAQHAARNTWRRSMQPGSRRALRSARRIAACFVAACLPTPLFSYWFEKFHWFVSSENYLVISGRDASQANGGRLHSMRTCAGTGPHLRRNVSPGAFSACTAERSTARHSAVISHWRLCGGGESLCRQCGRVGCRTRFS